MLPRGESEPGSDRLNIQQLTSSPIERESIGSGAAGGAALGAVLSLVVATSAVVPIIGAIIGAIGGAGAGHFANQFIQRQKRGNGVAGLRR